MLEVKHISKVFGKKDSKFTALSGINLKIPSGITVAITGKSGSGKSTLMHVMSGLDHVTKGSIVIDNKSLSSMSRKETDMFRATQMSFIFQSFFVEANQTCLYNVLLPLEIANIPRAQREKRALEALKDVELYEKANEKAMNLSGGQKQRLAIARAIVNKPKLIFADEPTGNLDSVTGNRVTKLLFDLNKKLNSTLVIVTHDEELASLCEMNIVLKDGKVQTVKTKKPANRRATT